MLLVSSSKQPEPQTLLVRCQQALGREARALHTAAIVAQALNKPGLSLVEFNQSPCGLGVGDVRVEVRIGRVLGLP